VNLGPGADVAESIALQADGRMVLAGSAGDGEDWGVVRLRFGGSPDPTFSGEGRLTIPLTDAAEGASGISLQEDGRLVLVGRVKGPEGSMDLAVVRRRPGGGPDHTFAHEGLLAVDVFGKVDVGTGIALQPNGKIVAVGQAWKAARPRIALVRVLAA